MNLPTRLHAKGSPLTEGAWAQFFQLGYCIARGVFDEFEIIEMRCALESLERLTHSLANNADLEDHVEHRIEHQGALFVFTKEEGKLKSLKRVVGCGSAQEPLLKASRQPRLLHAFSDLLLSHKMEQIICQFHPKRPGDDVAFAPHRDIEHRLNYDPHWKDVNGYGSYAIGVIAVDPSSSHNGGLHVVPESHIGVQLDQVIKAADDFNENWSLRALAPKLESGDVLFMHPYLVHWSTANQSDHSRMSLLSGMCCLGANQGLYPGECTNVVLHQDSTLG